MGKRTFLLPLVVALVALVVASPCWASPPTTAPAPVTSLTVPKTAHVGQKVTLWFRVRDPLARFIYNAQVSVGSMKGKLVANTGAIFVQHRTQAQGSLVWVPKAKGSYTACVVGMDMGAATSRALGTSCTQITVR